MKKYNRKSLLTLSLVALLSLLGASVTTAAPPTAPLAAQRMAVTPPATTPGIYMAFVDYDGEDPEHYGHEGELVIFDWNYLEGGGGSFYRNRIEMWIEQRAAQGKRFAFGFSPYNGRAAGGIVLPAYLRDNPEAVVNVGTEDDPWLIPKYWSPVYLDAYKRLVDRIAYWFAGDPRIEFIAIGTGIYGETRACDTQDQAAMQAAGLTSQVWINAVNQMTDYWLQAFSDGQGGLKTPLLQQVGTYTFHARERRDISWYSAQHGVGLSVNGLYPQQQGAVYTSGDWAGMGMYDAVLNFWTQVPIAFETYHYMLCDPQEVYWGMISGLDKHADYMRISVDLFRNMKTGEDRTENMEIFDWISPYLGVTITNTPSVWVAMRAPRHPFRTCWQHKNSPVQDTGLEPGNFSFWLDQDDSIPGGKTVPEANTCCDRYGNPLQWIGDEDNRNYNPYNPTAARPRGLGDPPH